ncbi:MAG: PAS domain-containing protein [Pseudomonadota bacterium]|nr:MAG: PAS domain-containing protein [Pseudomonadota bacterium]
MQRTDTAQTLLPASTQVSRTRGDAWKPLWFLCLYRLGVSGLFITLFVTDRLFAPLASRSPALFLAACFAYLLFGITSMLALRIRRPEFSFQVVVNVLVDIVAVTLLVHASGGASSGLGMLLVVAIAAGSIDMPGRTALMLAAVASIAMLLEQVFAHYAVGSSTGEYAQAGLVGLTFFTTAVLANVLGKRTRESEALAQRRGVDLANMAQLTEHIIQRMQTGIAVIDEQDRVRLVNESAWNMLGMPAMGGSQALPMLSRELSEQVNGWRSNPEWRSQAIPLSPDYADVLPRFARIGQDPGGGVLIFLEDTSAMAQRAQQLKLASLGQLTASIAHEVRNPLGAISHAGQLLEESDNLDDNDHRLTRIINDQSQRVNAIVENIMQLSRRDRSSPELIGLREFLLKFAADFAHAKQIDAEEIAVALDPQDVQVRFDAGQLRQILNNLCDNGLRHGGEYMGSPKVELRGGITAEFRRPFLDVVDHGPGISAADAQRVFEPFFTTEPAGTGLGLYISRELAESNQAHINYLPAPTGGGCFRITFQDPRKQII